MLQYFQYLKKKGADSMTENTTRISIRKLRPNPYQPRKTFDPNALDELAASIRQQGIIQPLIVRKKDDHYEIVAGERRWRAAREAGLEEVPAVVREYDDAAMMEVALMENMQRHDLDPLEEARGIQAMIRELHMTQEEAAEKLGKSRAYVSNSLRLLQLPLEVADMVAEGKLSVGQVRPLLSLKKPETAVNLARYAVREHWSARIVEEAVKASKQGVKFHVLTKTEKTLLKVKNPGKKKGKEQGETEKNSETSLYENDFQEKLTEYLATKVRVEPDGKKPGGRIVIEYYSPEDLQRLAELLEGTGEKPKKGRKAKTAFTV